MNKEQLAQIIIKNYMELAQAINPSIKNNEEELLSYYEALQEQIISEMKQIEEKRKIEILRDKKRDLEHCFVTETINHQKTKLLR